MTPAMYDAVDLCAGPGGWDEAARRLGLNVLGFEIDDAALQTRDAAGHHTATVPCEPSKAHPRGVRGLSMTEVDPRDYAPTLAEQMTRGQIGSPPCQGFSMAGKGEARADSERLLKELAEVRTLTDLTTMLEGCQQWMSHPGTALVLEPLRWALANCPSWLAWEQVPAVLPIWEACAVILRRLGYDVVTGKVNAEQYGVPQTRTRAVLLARAPWFAGGRDGSVLALPAPTHSRYHVRTPDKIDPDMPRWVSMAEALEWGLTSRPSFTVVAAHSATNTNGSEWGSAATRASLRDARMSEDPARWAPGDRVGSPRKADSDDVVTIGGEDYRARDLREAGRPPQVVTEKSRSWTRIRPATTVQGDARIWPPGHKINADDIRRDPEGAVAKYGDRKGSDSIRVLPEEAAVLQTFPADYPFRGSKTKVFQQIGNAVPPLLAEACLCAVLGIPFRPALRG